MVRIRQRKPNGWRGAQVDGPRGAALPGSMRLRRVASLVSGGALARRLDGLSALANAQAAQLVRGNADVVQYANGKGKKTTKDYVDEYYDEEDYDYEVEYAEDEPEEDYIDFWNDLDGVKDYAANEVAKNGYADYHDTDSSQGDYTRFIWYLGYGVKVGLNVHYTPGKVAGNMYIESIPNYAVPTPAGMVAAAPGARPATTKTWR